MNHSEAFATLKKERAASSMFPITHLNSPSVFETKNGHMGTVIRFEGVAFVTELNARLNQYVRTWHNAVLGLDESLMVYVTVVRKKQAIHLKGNFTSAFAKRVDEKYHQRFQGKNIYHNHWYVTLLLKGNTSGKTNRLLNWTKKVAGSQLREVNALQREQKIKRLAQISDQLLAGLSCFKPCLLGSRDEMLGYSELTAFLSLIPNAGESMPCREAANTGVISKGMTEVLGDESLYPQGNLGQYLCNHRLLFGTHIQFEGNCETDRRFAAMLSVKKYPTDTGSLILDPLLEVDAEFIATHSFAPESREQSLEAIRLKRGRLDCANDKAVSEIEALTQLEDDIASGRITLGYHHNTIMPLGRTVDEVETAIHLIQKAYSFSDMRVVKETLCAELPFWAQIPGNQHCIARSALITSKNFVEFCSLHNYQTGYCNSNHLGEAVTLLETPSRTPVYFNFHAKGSKTNPSKGHTVVFGANDAGKTTLIAFLDAQMNRYGGRSFFIDRDEASKIYILAAGNSSYTVISPKNAGNLSMNPLQLPDTTENRTFLKKWLERLLLRPHEQHLPGALAELVNECIDYSYEQLLPQARTLSHISQFFPVSFERWPELRRWMNRQDTQAAGEFAWLFDNDIDALALTPDKVGFDVTWLMDEVSSQISTPVYMYLVHRMRQSLDGRLSTIVFDEAWQVLDDPFWEIYLKSGLPTIRKLNGHFVFMTQSPATVVNSALRSTLIDNAATLIYFPNPQADEQVYIDVLKLTQAEYQTIRNNSPDSRLFLYKQGHESMLCKLDLQELRDELRVFSGNKKSVRLLDDILQETGTDNPESWLPVFLERSKV